MKFVFLFFISIGIFSESSTAQKSVKQNNTASADYFVDTPYRIKKYNEFGFLNSIPLTIAIYDSDCQFCNVDLAYINIRLKNATQTTFGSTLIFDTMNVQNFNSLFTNVSENDSTLHIQSFWDGLPIKNDEHTIIFTADTNFGFPSVSVYPIAQRFFYFTFLIPEQVLLNYDDIIDIEVQLGLDYATDETVRLRVFRDSLSYPKIPNWYRGDTHYHDIFTHNLAEFGLPPEPTKEAAKILGLDWITVTNHSCDYDNLFGTTHQNWLLQKNKYQFLNNQDSSMILIQGVEMSVNNSQGKVVHALTYPSYQNPISLPYMGDGGGDQSSTQVTVRDLSDSLIIYDGFCYAAHPFAEKDALSSAVNGGIWNVSDSLFPLNGSSHQYAGNIICNDIAELSDIYSESSNSLFRKNFVGLELLNMWYGLNSTNTFIDPWNTLYSSNNGFIEFDSMQPLNHYYRFYQGIEVYKFLLRKGLLQKNADSTLTNWKIFLSAGSDAHGSFNYATTDMTGGLIGYTNDNALGKLNTLVFCPNGMGINGNNVLKALKEGNSIISTGPIISLSVHFNSVDTVAIPGNDIFIQGNSMSLYSISVDLFNNDIFGEIKAVKLIGGFEKGEIEIQLTPNQQQTINFIDFITLIPDTFLENNHYFYIRAELYSEKEYSSSESLLRKKSKEYHLSYTNPIWVKSDILLSENIRAKKENNEKVMLYPNPANEFITLKLFESNEIMDVKVYSSQGVNVNVLTEIKNDAVNLIIKNLANGQYYGEIITVNKNYSFSFHKL